MTLILLPVKQIKNDPQFERAPIRIPRGDFGLAWLERDEVYSTFMRQN